MCGLAVQGTDLVLPEAFRSGNAVKSGSPPVHLNGGSAFRLREWGPHRVQKKNCSGSAGRSGTRINFCRKRNPTSRCGGHSYENSV
uniref:Uncharacterized protein n=1 Tax=Anguilla anguilla TaxID=7936 RepID=A0A0E9RKX6_ANGAN